MLKQSEWGRERKSERGRKRVWEREGGIFSHHCTVASLCSPRPAHHSAWLTILSVPARVCRRAACHCVPVRGEWPGPGVTLTPDHQVPLEGELGTHTPRWVSALAFAEAPQQGRRGGGRHQRETLRGQRLCRHLPKRGSTGVEWEWGWW